MFPSSLSFPAPLAKALMVALVVSASVSAAPTKAAGAARDDESPRREPGPAARGKVYAWTAADGLPYEYHVPKDYDAETGANLTLILHGNGLDERWAFWNHPAGEFRADDIVVSPDGTSFHQGLQNDEFLGERKDADRLHVLIEQLKELFTVRKVFLYGHSQGSFFVFYYAGEYPKDVDGVLGHASGVWNWSKRAKAGHHQAVALMHGTEDHIPYGQSWWGRKSYEEAGYPHVHLRTLWNWPHAPNHPQAAQVLAWVEAMSTDDPERLAVCLEDLSDPKVPMGLDWSALYEVASKLSEHPRATSGQSKAADKALQAVQKAGEAQVAMVTKALGKKGRLDRLPDSARAAEFVGVVLRLREEFRGTPVLLEFEKDHRKELAALEKNAEKARKDFWRDAEQRPQKAFAAGLKMLEQGFLDPGVGSILERMEQWAADPAAHDLDKRELAHFRQLSTVYTKGKEEGEKAYAALSARQRL